MNKLFAAASMIALTAGAAQAGGIERTTQSVGLIFEKGNYAELSFGSVKPKVSGVGAGTSPPSLIQPSPGLPTGDMAGDYTQLSLGFKMAINEQLDIGLIVDNPFGADVNYPVTGYYASGSVAELNSTAMTLVGRYKLPSNVSFIAGLRYQTMSATASIPFIASYTAKAEKDGGLGYVIGIAYEKPEIALRVALTYNSVIKHKFSTTETGAVAGSSVTNVETPQSVNLEAQTGIAKDTLLFGSIRWVDWSSFELRPIGYATANGSALISYENDSVAYTLGVGRKFNDNWSAAVSLGYEKSAGGFASNLGPTDGKKSITVGATYTQDKMKITGGITYVDIGDADTTLSAPTGLASGNFRNNHAVGVGFRIGYSF